MMSCAFTPSRGSGSARRRPLIEPLVVLLRGSDADGSGASSSLQVRAAAALSLGRFALKAELGKLPYDRAQRVRNALLDAINDPIEEVEVPPPRRRGHRLSRHRRGPGHHRRGPTAIRIFA